VKKNGRRRGLQRYKCLSCKRRFTSSRKEKLDWIQDAYEDYSVHKQTYKELSAKYGKSARTLRKYFDNYAGATGEIHQANESIVLIMDATFFGRGYGILLARSLKKALLWQEIESETILVYSKLLDDLESSGYCFSGFVIDGRSGIRKLLETRYPEILIQFCQFHQIQIVKRYIPRKAQTDAAKSLRDIALGIPKLDEKGLVERLNRWYEKHGYFLNEKTFIEGTSHWRYTHGRLRSAFRSLKRNLPYLFTYQKFPALKMPNTTNHCDGLFAHIKQKVLIHRGISQKRRKQMIDFLLENF